MPHSSQQTLAAALTDLFDEFRVLVAEGQEPSPSGYAEQVLVEILPAAFVPAPKVAWVTGLLTMALVHAGLRVDSPPAHGFHSDVLHFDDGLGQTWTLRVVGQVQR